MKLPHDFEDFFQKIILGKEQRDRIDSASDRLKKYLADWYRLFRSDVFEQGSYPNDTAIKPDPQKKDGEYDVDIVAICISSEMSASDALKDLEAALDAETDYSKRIESESKGKRPCVRLRYADDEIGGFHVDVVPARLAESSHAPLEIPRLDSGWRESAPREYTQWCRDQGEEFARTVQMLKRWRDHNQSVHQAIKSIVLQILIANHIPSVGSDAERITRTLRGIAEFVALHDEVPDIHNPVLPPEIITERWQSADYHNFRRTVSEAADLADQALAAEDLNQSRELWRLLFGEDFPAPEKRGVLSPAPMPATSRQNPQKAPRRVEWG